MNINNDFVENHTFEELQIGQSARLLRTLTPQDIQAFAAVSGDTNPAHLNAEYANETLFHGVIAHGMWSGALISALLGTQFPGTGTIYLDQALHFSRPVRIGDTLTVCATVTAKDEQKKIVELACEAVNQNGEQVVRGVARVLAPPHKIRMPRGSLPQIRVFDPEARFNDLLALARGIPAVRCAVVHPCDEGSLSGAMEAAAHGLLEPVLIGPEMRIRAIAEEFNLDLNGMTVVNKPHSHAAAEHASTMAANGEVQSLMKGSLHTDELIHAVLARQELRTGRLRLRPRLPQAGFR